MCIETYEITAMFNPNECCSVYEAMMLDDSNDICDYLFIDYFNREPNSRCDYFDIDELLSIISIEDLAIGLLSLSNDQKVTIQFTVEWDGRIDYWTGYEDGEFYITKMEFL